MSPSTWKGTCLCSMKYLKSQDIGLTTDKLELLSDSQFFPLVQGMMNGELLKENSTNIT